MIVGFCCWNSFQSRVMTGCSPTEVRQTIVSVVAAVLGAAAAAGAVVGVAAVVGCAAAAGADVGAAAGAAAGAAGTGVSAGAGADPQACSKELASANPAARVPLFKRLRRLTPPRMVVCSMKAILSFLFGNPVDQ